ncbi:glycerate kinase, partial [Streptococcus suis]
AEGWRAARPDDEVLTVPLADGGDGTLDVVAAAGGGVRHTVEVADARGRASTGDWLALPDGTGLVEAAQAIGLTQLSESEREPT